MINIISKLNLYFTITETLIYSYIRKKFPDYLDRLEKQKLLSSCPDILPILGEMDFFYTKISPISISLQERKEKGIINDVTLTYGETTWSAISDIFDDLKLTENDVFYDLGCGSAKTVFFVNSKYGCKSIGIDKIEYFIKISNTICKNLKLDNISFICSDFFKVDFSNGTLFYITATCFPEVFLEKIVKVLEKTKSGTKVIIAARQLNSEHLKLYKVKRCSFSWAKDNVYFYEKT